MQNADPQVVATYIDNWTAYARQLLIEGADRCVDMDSFIHMGGSLIYIMHRIAAGGFKGTFRLEVRGGKVLPVTIQDQQVDVAAIYHQLLDGVSGTVDKSP